MENEKSILRDELVRMVAADTGLTLKNTRLFLESLENNLITLFKKDISVKLQGFASFKVLKKKPRRAYDIHSEEKGQYKVIQPKKQVKFVLAEEMDKYINGKQIAW